MAKWIEIDRKDVKVGDIIGHNAVERKVTEIFEGKIYTDPGTFYYVNRGRINKKVTINTTNVTWTVEPSEPKAPEPIIPDEPSHCLHCGAKAYVGLWEVGCSAKCKDSQ